MNFRIADTFTDSLAKLTNDEQKATKTTAFDLQVNPAHPSMQLHKLDRAKDPNFWSVRVSRDVRLIVHKTDRSLMLCYVDHHDDAYTWAERRRIETHPKTGAAQFVEVRERVEEIVIKQPVVASKPMLFENVSDDDLLSYGVPPEWLDDVRRVNEDTIFHLAEHLPQEAAEALVDLAVGVVPDTSATAPTDADPFAHPDAQRRFRVVTNVKELERALEYPWDKWSVFLHPAQRRYVEREYNGPARVSGTAGTGKTIVALHRAVHLAKTYPDSKVLLTTFSSALANALRVRVGRLAGNEPALMARIHVRHLSGLAYDLCAEAFGQPNIAPESTIRECLESSRQEGDATNFSAQFVWREWNEIVDAWQLTTWDDYRDVARLGRKTRVGSKQREQLWRIFDSARGELARRNLKTWSDIYGQLTAHSDSGATKPFEFAIVDEAQDVGVAELRFLAALVAREADGLFFTGDLGQRIFQQPFSWKALGVDVRGRSHTLRINYRTSHQIRSHADRLLPPAIADIDGVEESRRGAVSVFDGPPPTVRAFATPEDESAAVGEFITALMADGVCGHEIGIFVRDHAQRERAQAAVRLAKASAIQLGDNVDTATGKISIGTMHLAKGLEFRAVVVMACDDEVIPSQERIETIADDADLEEVYNTERHLLYVACTRARDHLLVTGVEPASEFLDDLAG